MDRVTIARKMEESVQYLREEMTRNDPDVVVIAASNIRAGLEGFQCTEGQSKTAGGYAAGGQETGGRRGADESRGQQCDRVDSAVKTFGEQVEAFYQAAKAKDNQGCAKALIRMEEAAQELLQNDTVAEKVGMVSTGPHSKSSGKDGKEGREQGCGCRPRP